MHYNLKYILNRLKHHFAATFFIVVIFLFSCKTTKNIEQGPPPIRTQKEAVEALQKRNFDFKWFTAKGDAEFESSHLAGSGTMLLRIKKDSLIWMQGKKFGIEGFRGIINKDSFYLANRLEKYYIGESISVFMDNFGIDLGFDDMQQLLVGNVFLPATEEISSFSQEGKHCKLISNTSGYNITYTLNAYDMLLYSMVIADRGGHKINLALDDYRKFGKIKVPYTRNFNFQSAGQPPYFLNVKVDELEVDEYKPMPFTLPTHYKRLRL
jgi:hypothetical protein